MVNTPLKDEALHAAWVAWNMSATINGIPVSELVDSAVNTNYDIWLINRLERELWNINLTLPAKKSPDIPKIIWVIEQIIWEEVSLHNIYQYLENTSKNPVSARNDLQRCRALLQKISWIQDQQDVNWELIFLRLELK